MSKLLLLLAYLAGTVDGRRVHSLMERSQSSSMAKDPISSAQALAKLLKASKPADAFNPPGSRLHLSSYPSRSSPVQMAEMRVDVGDGGTYTMEEFKEYYTEQGEDWEAKWNAATPAPEKKTFDELNVGDVIDATVMRIAPFGAFCDIGATQDALLHISQISDQFISDIYEHVQEGQKITVTIKELDAGRGRIGLTARADGGGDGRPAVDPDATPLDQLEMGQTVTGTVRSIQSFGAFINIGAQKDGLLHISEITNDFISDVNEHLAIGQEVTATIKELDINSGRIGLSCRDEYGGGGGGGGGGSSWNEEGTPLEELSVGQEVTGTVQTILNFGAFVDIGAQKQALLHISEITDEFISEVSEKLEVGDEVRAVIKELDIEQGKIGISSRDLEG